MRLAEPFWQRLLGVVRGGRSEKPVLGLLRLSTPAWLCVTSSLLMCVLGVYIIDLTRASEWSGFGGMHPLSVRQAVFICVGIVAALVVALPHYRFMGMVSGPLMVLMVALLILILLPVMPDSIVSRQRGARSWINLGVADFQPSEIVKAVYVVLIAYYLRHRDDHRTVKGLARVGVMTAVPVGLITVQPDLGTSLLFIPALFAMLMAAGARLRHLGLVVVCVAMAAPASYPLLEPHQKVRIDGLVQQIRGDRTTAHGINFQSFTAQTLAGAGGIAGVGDARSRAMVRYSRLPEAHNDMIFAVIVNRFGVLGGVGVVVLYGVWVAGALLTSLGCKSGLGRLIPIGLAAFVVGAALIHIGMNIGLLPVTGINLPFISYGGSSMLSSWLMTGLVLSVGLHRAEDTMRESFRFEEDDEH